METKQWRYECQKCGRRFSRRVSLTRHNLTLHQSVIWACTLCSAKLNSKYYLIRHVKRFHQSLKLDEGSSADKIPQLADNTVRQQDAHAGNESGVSDLIQETNQVKNDLVFQGRKNTYRVPIGIKQRRYICQKCGWKFCHNKDLYQHDQHVHQRVILDSTLLCSEKLHSKDNLKKNMKCFHTSSVLDEGLSVDNTLRQQAAPAGIPGDGSGVSSDLIQKTNFQSSRNAFVTRLERYLQGAKSMSSHLEKTKLLSFANPEVNSVQNQRITSVATVVETSEVTSIEMAEGKSVEMAEVTSVEMPEGTSVEMAEGTSVGIVQSQDNSVVDAKHRASDNKRTPEDNGAEYQVSKKRCLVDITLDQKAMASSDNSRDFISQKNLSSKCGTFGQSCVGQFGSSSAFGQSSFGQISALGQTSIGQTGTASIFGQASVNQFGTSSAFGPSLGATAVFSQVSSSQPGSFASFGQSTPGVTGSTAFGQSSNDTTSSSQVKTTTVFGQPQQAASLFGSAFGKPEQQAAPNNPFTFSFPATKTAIQSNVSNVGAPSQKIFQKYRFLFTTTASTIASSAPFSATATNLAPSSSKPVFGSSFASTSSVAEASPSKAEVSKESKPQSSSFQPQMLFGKPIAPSEPGFGSSFASTSSVAEASPSKAEVSKESKPQSSSFQPQMLFGKPIAPSEPGFGSSFASASSVAETPPSKAEVSKESKPQLSSFQPQMLFGKPIAPSEPGFGSSFTSASSVAEASPSKAEVSKESNPQSSSFQPQMLFGKPIAPSEPGFGSSFASASSVAETPPSKAEVSKESKPQLSSFQPQMLFGKPIAPSEPGFGSSFTSASSVAEASPSKAEVSKESNPQSSSFQPQMLFGKPIAPSEPGFGFSFASVSSVAEAPPSKAEVSKESNPQSSLFEPQMLCGKPIAPSESGFGSSFTSASSFAEAPPSKAQVSKESKPQSSSFQPQMLFGKPIAPSEPVFGSSFASASAVAEASPSKAEVSKESRPETPPSKAEVSKESKPQSSSFQPQMLFDKPIAPSEQKMTDEQKFSDNPSAAASRENVFRPENEQIDLNNPFDVIERVFQLTGKTAMTTDALCAEMNHFFHIVWSRFRKEYGSYLTFIKKHSNVFDLNGKIISLRGHKNTNEMEVQHDDISKKNPMGRHVEGLQCCSICGQRFFTLVGLRNHQRNHHPENASASRSETEAGSNSNSIIVIQFNQQATEVEVESLVTSAGKKSVKDVISDEEKKFAFGCQSCKRRFKRLFDLNRHFRAVHLERKIQCCRCSTKFDCLRALSSHFQHCQRPNTKMTTCQEQLFLASPVPTDPEPSNVLLVEDKTQVINSPTLEIQEECNEVKASLKGVESDVERKFACQSCERRFRRQFDLNRHFYFVHRKLNHQCNQCGAELGSLGSVKHHLWKQHGIKMKKDLEHQLFLASTDPNDPENSKAMPDEDKVQVADLPALSIQDEVKIVDHEFRRDDADRLTGVAHFQFAEPESVEKALSLDKEQIHGIPVIIRKSVVNSMEELRKHIANKSDTADEEQFAFIIFIKFAQHATKDQVINFFSPAGQVVETEFLRNSQGLTGYAYIRFADPQSVENALMLGNGTLLDKPVQIKKSNLKSMRISKRKYPSQETAGKDDNDLELTTSKQSSNVYQKEHRTQTPTPRLCIHCHEVIGSRILMHRHMQTMHRDILLVKKINSRQQAMQTGSTVEDQADAPINFMGKQTVATSINPSESVKPIQGKVGIVEQLETSEMEEMNMQAEDGRRTKTTVTSHRSSNVNQKEDRTQTPTPRPCVHCHEIIGSWALMHQHMQTTHRDILCMKKTNPRQLERQTGSTVEDQADAPIVFTKKKTVDTSINPSESVRPIQGKVGIVEQLETSEMEEMNVQAEDRRRTKTTVTSHRSSKVNQKEYRTQTPTPRPCVHCHEIIGSRALMRQHMKTAHQDILLEKMINSRQLAMQTGSTVEDQANAPITFTGKKTVDTSINPSKSVRPIQGKVGSVEQLETSEMEEMNVQAEDGRRTITTVTSHRSSKVNQKVCRQQPPTPRPCVHCHEIIGSKALMQRHVQVVHRDILDKRKRTLRRLERQLERQMGSTVKNQADAPFSFRRKVTLDTSISQSKSVRPIQGKVGVVEQLKTSEMKEMNVQTGDGRRRTKTTVTSHRSSNVNQKAYCKTAPIPRPCVHCHKVIGSRELMRQHIQFYHRDYLLMKKNSRLLESQAGSTVELKWEDQANAQINFPEKMILDTSLNPSESVRPIQGEVGIVEWMEEMNVQAGDVRSTPLYRVHVRNESEKTPDSSCCIIIIKCQKDATEKDVKQFLSSAGKITETKFPLVSDASKERLAYIRFDNPASVEKALSLGNEKLLGNPVYIRKSNLKSLNCLRKTNPDQEGSALGRISRKDVTKSQSDIRKDDNSQKIAQSEMSADVEEDSTCIVFVKYNNFVTDDQLEEFLSSAGQIAEHEIVHDFNGPKGIAYIRYENAQSVENVLTLNNQKLFGHPVMIKKSLVKKINCRPINNRNRVSSTVSNENTKLRNKGLKMESNNDDSLKISTLDSSSNLADHPQKNSDVEKVLPKKQDDVMTPDSTVPEIHPIPTTEEMEDWHGRLWIQDLDCRVKSSDLWELFEPFGELEFATVNKLDPHGSKTQDRYNPKTSASVRFCSRDDANRAIQLLNGIKMYDIPISIKKVPGPGDPTELWLAEKRKKAVALSSVETENLDNLVTSRFLLATNVFDVQGSKEPGWDLALCREILDRSSSCGAGLVHIYIDPVSPQGSVYMKCYDLKSAEMIVHYLQTDQRKIQLDCLPAALYYHLFPNSESAVKLLDRFAFALPPVWPMPKY